MSDMTTGPSLYQLESNVAELRNRLRVIRRLPVSTYRLQLQPAFTFRDAGAIVPYLARLGVTDCYCSPYFRARAGSTHGYDICDFGELNPDLGADSDYDALVNELATYGMGHILDFVPNHMAVEPVQNRWWRDVLEHGPASVFAAFFDIDWNPVKPELKGKILLPFLADHYGEVLERGELELIFEDGGLLLRYGADTRPIDPRQYPRVLRKNLEALQTDLGEADASLQEFLSILTALDHLPPTSDIERNQVPERLRESRLARERLSKLATTAPRIRQHIADALRTINGQAGRPESFDALHELLEAQSYRLAFWKTAVHEINFRRFFDINQLAGLRMEDPAVFNATHALVLRLIRERKVTGLRLDHLDGLFDPAGYLHRLQTAVLQGRLADFEGRGDEPSEAQRLQLDGWRETEGKQDPQGPVVCPLYVVTEKILSSNESLPGSWPIHGTTGYDFLNDVNRLFIDPRSAHPLKRFYERFTGRSVPYSDVVYESKDLITWTAMASELNVLAHTLNRISEGDRRARDFTLDSLREALRAVAICLPVYRTYVSTAGATEMDRQVIDIALRRARRRNPAMEASVFDFLRETLLPSCEKLPEDEYRSRLQFAMKFQQYTGPLQAKGIEDTAFYRYNVLVSLNEVGGDPQRFAGTPAQFHESNQRRRDCQPYTLLATATHDTKRGEDARARLNVVSEIPDEWRRQVSRWTRINAPNRTTIDGEPAPDRNDEYLFYQALLGCWPAEPDGTMHSSAPAELVQRLRDYMLKAVKEAKVHTSWISPNEAYDRAVAAFVAQTLTGRRSERFLAEFLPFQQRIARLGMINSLAQVILKIVSPGVPDFYQGTELWDLSLVDPDNRRPVDFALRQRLLVDFVEPLLDWRSGQAAGRRAAIAETLEHWHDGRIKLFVTACGLRLRRRHPHLFTQGHYRPLLAEGAKSDYVIALAREHETGCALAAVPRFVSRVVPRDFPLPVGDSIWHNSQLLLPKEWPTRSFRNLFTGEIARPTEESGRLVLKLSDVFALFPIALFEAESR